MRLNSSADCIRIDERAFPETCSGPHPLIASYISHTEPIYYGPKTLGNFTVNVCVPGDSHTSPWTLSRDRQDISEDLFIKVHVPYNTSWEWYLTTMIGDVKNLTVQCTANTTRGFFEMGNIRNNFTAGPLLEKWPDQESFWKDFNVSRYRTQASVQRHIHLTDILGLLERKQWACRRSKHNE